MPEVDYSRDFSASLAKARELSGGSVDSFPQRGVAVITPGGLIVPYPCPSLEVVHPKHVAKVRSMVDEDSPQVVTAIAYNDMASSLTTGPPVLEMIPFLPDLLVMASLGHNVAVFEGHPKAFAAGCREVDLLLVDGAMADL